MSKQRRAVQSIQKQSKLEQRVTEHHGTKQSHGRQRDAMEAYRRQHGRRHARRHGRQRVALGSNAAQSENPRNRLRVLCDPMRIRAAKVVLGLSLACPYFRTEPGYCDCTPARVTHRRKRCGPYTFSREVRQQQPSWNNVSSSLVVFVRLSCGFLVSPLL